MNQSRHTSNPAAGASTSTPTQTREATVFAAVEALFSASPACVDVALAAVADAVLAHTCEGAVADTSTADCHDATHEPLGDIFAFCMFFLVECIF